MGRGEIVDGNRAGQGTGWREKGLASMPGDSQKTIFMEMLPWENRK